MNRLIRKRSSSVTAATAGFTLIACSCTSQSPSVDAFKTATTTTFVTSHGRNYRSLLFASNGKDGRSKNQNRLASRSPIIEKVQPLTSASEERRINALNALTQQQLKKGSKNGDKWFEESPLFADMDAAAMLLETFTQATNNESSSSQKEEEEEQLGVARRRMGSVAGATRMSTLRQQAVEEGGYALSPRESQYLYKNDGSNQARWAVESMIEQLDKKMKERPEDDLSEDGEGGSIQSNALGPSKRKRGRPRKNPLPDEPSNDEVVKVNPLKPVNSQDGEPSKDKLTQSSARVTGGSLMKKRDPDSLSGEDQRSKSSSSKVMASKGVEPLVGASAIVKKQRRRVVKQLPKSRRDANGNLMPGYLISRHKGKSDDNEATSFNNGSRGASPDSLNLNRYYKTELLNAREEYSLGMKVKFMVKCEAVHEGLMLETGLIPTIAEWAAACGFDSHDAEMCSENYVENDLDRQIRPTGGDTSDLDPNMFIGNGLVNDTGVGRGKGRAKKPPPTYLGKFYDDSYDKFKRKKDDNQYAEDEMEEEADIFLYQLKAAPGEPINRGSPRLFREMMLTAKEAKQRMVQCNMRLVVSIARRYHGVGVNVQDLVQEGSLGLARAAEKFDPKKGFKFSTYASW